MLKTISTSATLLLCSVQLQAQAESYDGPVEVFPDTTMALDSGWYIYNWDSIPLQDSSQTEMAIADSLFEEELPWECGGTQDFVPELPLPGILVVNDPTICFTPIITFVPYTYAMPIWEGCWDPFGDYMVIVDPYKGRHEIDLFNQDTSRGVKSISSFSETHARQISSSPPPEVPDPPKPAPVPKQPWYECILPRAIRVTARYST